MLHANHLFNAIHSSMRQFGSSLHHNGMSFFVSTVPAGTHFYHGRGTADPVEGLEWLAFEPEHALFFANPRRPPPPPPHKGPRPPPPPPPPSDQLVFGHAPPEEDPSQTGYLHTYVTKHPLRLLYLDGMSAAKSEKGTLDTQDYILARAERGSWGERERATEMCERARNEWRGGIDGILRMEAGFEIILCSFEAHVTPLRITAAARSDQGNGEERWSWIQAITARYHGIGGGRVQLDYDDFVSAYSFPGAELFAAGQLPRLNATDKHTLKEILAQVDRIATRPPSFDRQQATTAARHDWQAVTDMIVARHGPRLAHLASPSIAKSSPSVLAETLDRFMRPFIDYSARDVTAETQRCTDEYIPADWPHNQASVAIRAVSHRICSTIASLLAAETEDVSSALKTIAELKEWLAWTTWKQCTDCTDDEVCIVPMWPFGSKEDHERPSCANQTTLGDHQGYWDGPFRRPRRPGPP